MGFCWSTLHVKNLEESVDFYTNIIGLKLVNRLKGGPDTEIVFLGDEGAQIELVYSGDKQNTINVGNDISWGFEVKSLDEVLELVKREGISIDGDPVQPNPHVRFFYIKDPNGLRIQLIEKIA